MTDGAMVVRGREDDNGVVGERRVCALFPLCLHLPHNLHISIFEIKCHMKPTSFESPRKSLQSAENRLRNGQELRALEPDGGGSLWQAREARSTRGSGVGGSANAALMAGRQWEASGIRRARGSGVAVVVVEPC